LPKFIRAAAAAGDLLVLERALSVAYLDHPKSFGLPARDGDAAGDIQPSHPPPRAGVAA